MKEKPPSADAPPVITKDTFELLEKEFIALSIYWDLQRQLFRSSDPKDLGAFEWGAHAWSYLNRGLVDSMFIIIGRLMDPAKTGKKDNLSLAGLLERFPAGTQKARIALMVAETRADYDAKIKPWRHQVIAHADLEIAKNRAGLPNLPFTEFDEMVKSLLEIASRLHLYICGSDNDFGGVAEWSIAPVLKT